MKYQRIYSFDLANGPGIRVSFFVSGCNIHCPGCFNPEAQDFNCGKEVSAKEYFAICNLLKSPYYQGLSILGGEPFDQDEEGINFLCNLCKMAHELNKDVWIWSGHLREELEANPLQRELLHNCDVLVDGPFIEEFKIKYPAGQFKGSFNQNTILLVENS